MRTKNSFSAPLTGLQIVKRALYHNACAVIFAHNHPSGIAEVSRADEDITQRVMEILNMVDVRVLDHIIVGDSETVSLTERGNVRFSQFFLL